jgi:site-specific DNA-methyltransferase (adenine-specific)
MMRRAELPRLDRDPELRGHLLPACRLRRGEVWRDSRSGHRVGCLDAAERADVARLVGRARARLAVHDPPYNLCAFEERAQEDYATWCERWVRATVAHLADDAALYVFLGADQQRGFQPLPEFMLMMRGIEELRSRSFITLRNQRGYGTQRNWMAVRQELLYYTRGDPPFEVQYTATPKRVRGYYKQVGGRRTENLERGRAPTLRAGNVWVDVQQVFYRLEENVPGCYAQKPLAALERILAASSRTGDLVLDFFAHSGTTLLAAERTGRRCYTMDLEPVFCELAIRRLERFRASGRLGWQTADPFGSAVC